MTHIQMFCTFLGPFVCAMSHAPLLSVSRRRSCLVSVTIFSSWYLVVGLSSIRSAAGLLITGIRNSSANDASHVSVFAPVSAAI